VKSLSLVRALTLALALPALGAYAQSVSDDIDTLKTMEYAWVRAVESSDRATVDRLLDPSYFEITARGVRRTKADLLRAEPPPMGTSQTLQDMRVQVRGDSAVVTGTNLYSREHGAAMNFRFYDVFVRKDGMWRVVSSQMVKQ
jgi:hypothetical protein